MIGNEFFRHPLTVVAAAFLAGIGFGFLSICSLNTLDTSRRSSPRLARVRFVMFGSPSLATMYLVSHSS